jgi:hypothetical protein
MRFILCALTMVMLSGCAATYRQNTLAAPTAKLVREKSVVIATPANGFYEATQYTSSGQMTAGAIRASFAPFTDAVTVHPSCQGLVCLRQDQSISYGYYVVPEILHWEDRATEWSGKPDRIEIKMTIYDGASAAKLASTIIVGKSKWATFGGDHPQDLLPAPLNKYIQSLY